MLSKILDVFKYHLTKIKNKCNLYSEGGGEKVVSIAQLVERRTVDPGVAGSIPVTHPIFFAPVAQLDRASASGAEGSEFNSRRAHQSKNMRLTEIMLKN